MAESYASEQPARKEEAPSKSVIGELLYEQFQAFETSLADSERMLSYLLRWALDESHIGGWRFEKALANQQDITTYRQLAAELIELINPEFGFWIKEIDRQPQMRIYDFSSREVDYICYRLHILTRRPHGQW